MCFSSRPRLMALVCSSFILGIPSRLTLLPPSTENLIVLDEERSPSLIKGVNFGILQPGVSVVKTLHLISSGAAGERMVDVSIQSTVVGTETPENPELQDMTETLQTLVVPTVEAIKVKYGVVYKRAAAARVGVADLRTYDHDFWDDGDGGEAVVTAQMECAGPWGLEVASVKLLREVGPFLQRPTDDCLTLALRRIPSMLKLWRRLLILKTISLQVRAS